MNVASAGALIATVAVLATPALASNSYSPSIYQPPVHSRGGALTACPNATGLESFNIAAITRAAVIARRYGLISVATDLRVSDRAWWPQVRAIWRRRVKPLKELENQIVDGSEALAKSGYAVIARFSCGQSLVSKSLEVTIGPSHMRCAACRSQLWFVDRRGHTLLYYVH
jgi:hypothetical protein